jgi:hypothetical protein
MSGTENELAELVVGARGWEHAQWLEAYYPDDLPEDWRLDYYANEFGCVVLPPEVWMTSDEKVIEQWLEDVEDDFLFYLELPAQPGELTASLSVFAGRCAGAILHEGNSADWQDVLGDIPVLYSEDTGNLKCYRHAGQAETVLAWLAAGPGEKIELPVLREQIEAALTNVAAKSRLAFIIGDEAPAMENLQNAKVVAELLGA